MSHWQEMCPCCQEKREKIGDIWKPLPHLTTSWYSIIGSLYYIPYTVLIASLYVVNRHLKKTKTNVCHENHFVLDSSPNGGCLVDGTGWIPQYYIIPVVPHKAVAEVSEQETYRRRWLLWIRDGRAKPLIDRKVVGVVFAGVVAMVAVVTSPTTAGCSVMYCNCSCSCSVVEL